MLLVDLLGHAGEHQSDDGDRDEKDHLLAEGHTAKADGDDRGAEQQSPAEDAPIDRPWRGAVKPHQVGPGNRDGGNDQPQQEHGLVAEHLREPTREAGDRKDAGPQSEPSKHLNEAELALDLGKRTRRAVGVFAVDDLRGHGVGDHVLQHDADHDEELGGNVEGILAGESDPAAGGAGENDEPGGDQARTDIDIGTALGAQDRH